MKAKSTSAVISFIDVLGIPISEFEKRTSMTPGTIINTFVSETELPNKYVNNIIAVFGAELIATGYHICSLDGWMGEHNDYLIVERNLNALFFSTYK